METSLNQTMSASAATASSSSSSSSASALSLSMSSTADALLAGETTLANLLAAPMAPLPPVPTSIILANSLSSRPVMSSTGKAPARPVLDRGKALSKAMLASLSEGGTFFGARSSSSSSSSTSSSSSSLVSLATESVVVVATTTATSSLATLSHKPAAAAAATATAVLAKFPMSVPSLTSFVNSPSIGTQSNTNAPVPAITLNAMVPSSSSSSGTVATAAPLPSNVTKVPVIVATSETTSTEPAGDTSATAQIFRIPISLAAQLMQLPLTSQQRQQLLLEHQQQQQSTIMVAGKPLAPAAPGQPQFFQILAPVGTSIPGGNVLLKAADVQQKAAPQTTQLQSQQQPPQQTFISLPANTTVSHAPPTLAVKSLPLAHKTSPTESINNTILAKTSAPILAKQLLGGQAKTSTTMGTTAAPSLPLMSSTAELGKSTVLVVTSTAPSSSIVLSSAMASTTNTVPLVGANKPMNIPIVVSTIGNNADAQLNISVSQNNVSQANVKPAINAPAEGVQLPVDGVRVEVPLPPPNNPTQDVQNKPVTPVITVVTTAPIDSTATVTATSRSRRRRPPQTSSLIASIQVPQELAARLMEPLPAVDDANYVAHQQHQQELIKQLLTQHPIVHIQQEQIPQPQQQQTVVQQQPQCVHQQQQQQQIQSQQQSIPQQQQQTPEASVATITICTQTPGKKRNRSKKANASASLASITVNPAPTTTCIHHAAGGSTANIEGSVAMTNKPANCKMIPNASVATTSEAPANTLTLTTQPKPMLTNVTVPVTINLPIGRPIILQPQPSTSQGVNATLKSQPATILLNTSDGSIAANMTVVNKNTLATSILGTGTVASGGATKITPKIIKVAKPAKSVVPEYEIITHIQLGGQPQATPPTLKLKGNKNLSGLYALIFSPNKESGYNSLLACPRDKTPTTIPPSIMFVVGRLDKNPGNGSADNSAKRMSDYQALLTTVAEILQKLTDVLVAAAEEGRLGQGSLPVLIETTVNQFANMSGSVIKPILVTSSSMNQVLSMPSLNEETMAKLPRYKPNQARQRTKSTPATSEANANQKKIEYITRAPNGQFLPASERIPKTNLVRFLTDELPPTTLALEYEAWCRPGPSGMQQQSQQSSSTEQSKDRPSKLASANSCLAALLNAPVSPLPNLDFLGQSFCMSNEDAQRQLENAKANMLNQEKMGVNENKFDNIMAKTPAQAKPKQECALTRTADLPATGYMEPHIAKTTTTTCFKNVIPTASTAEVKPDETIQAPDMMQYYNDNYMIMTSATDTTTVAAPATYSDPMNNATVSTFDESNDPFGNLANIPEDLPIDNYLSKVDGNIPVLSENIVANVLGTDTGAPISAEMYTPDDSLLPPTSPVVLEVLPESVNNMIDLNIKADLESFDSAVDNFFGEYGLLSSDLLDLNNLNADATPVTDNNDCYLDANGVLRLTRQVMMNVNQDPSLSAASLPFPNSADLLGVGDLDFGNNSNSAFNLTNDFLNFDNDYMTRYVPGWNDPNMHIDAITPPTTASSMSGVGLSGDSEGLSGSPTSSHDDELNPLLLGNDQAFSQLDQQLFNSFYNSNTNMMGNNNFLPTTLLDSNMMMGNEPTTMANTFDPNLVAQTTSTMSSTTIVAPTLGLSPIAAPLNINNRILQSRLSRQAREARQAREEQRLFQSISNNGKRKSRSTRSTRQTADSGSSPNTRSQAARSRSVSVSSASYDMEKDDQFSMTDFIEGDVTLRTLKGTMKKKKAINSMATEEATFTTTTMATTMAFSASTAPAMTTSTRNTSSPIETRQRTTRSSALIAATLNQKLAMDSNVFNMNTTTTNNNNNNTNNNANNEMSNPQDLEDQLLDNELFETARMISNTSFRSNSEEMDSPTTTPLSSVFDGEPFGASASFAQMALAAGGDCSVANANQLLKSMLEAPIQSYEQRHRDYLIEQTIDRVLKGVVDADSGEDTIIEPFTAANVAAEGNQNDKAKKAASKKRKKPPTQVDANVVRKVTRSTRKVSEPKPTVKVEKVVAKEVKKRSHKKKKPSKAKKAKVESSSEPPKVEYRASDSDLFNRLISLDTSALITTSVASTSATSSSPPKTTKRKAPLKRQAAIEVYTKRDAKKAKLDEQHQEDDGFDSDQTEPASPIDFYTDTTPPPPPTSTVAPVAVTPSSIPPVTLPSSAPTTPTTTNPIESSTKSEPSTPSKKSILRGYQHLSI